MELGDQRPSPISCRTRLRRARANLPSPKATFCQQSYNRNNNNNNNNYNNSNNSIMCLSVCLLPCAVCNRRSSMSIISPRRGETSMHQAVHAYARTCRCATSIQLAIGLRQRYAFSFLPSSSCFPSLEQRKVVTTNQQTMKFYSDVY